jgi:hypothetical protein
MFILKLADSVFVFVNLEHNMFSLTADKSKTNTCISISRGFRLKIIHNAQIYLLYRLIHIIENNRIEDTLEGKLGLAIGKLVIYKAISIRLCFE